LVDIRPDHDDYRASLDRVLVRSSSELDLQPLAWRTDESFVDSTGEALSDHPAVAVRIAWDAHTHALVH
jgi:hypothetical protein